MIFASQVPVFQNSPPTHINNYNLQIIDAVRCLKYQGELSERCNILFIKYFNISNIQYRVSCVDSTNVCDMKSKPPHLL